MEGAEQLNDNVERESGEAPEGIGLLLEAVRGEVGALAIRKREFEAFEERVKSLQASVTDAEGRMETSPPRTRT